MPEDRDSCELLRAIVHRDDAVTQPLGRLAANIRDWDPLLKLAQAHRMSPMLFSRLADLGPAVPPPAQEHLRAEYERNVFHSTANAAELIGVLQEFDREAIPAMPFKGVVLAAAIYGDFRQRPAGDLDVLVYYRDLQRAAAVLMERGYQLKTPVRADGAPVDPGDYEYQFARPADGMLLELRWRLTERRFRRNLDMDWVWPRRGVAMLAGAKVPNLDSEIALLVLCLHGSKHRWSRAIWICDVAQLLASFSGLDWTQVTREAGRVGLLRPLALGVLLAHRVAGAAVPLDVLRRFESDATACRLARHIQDNLFDTPPRSSLGRMFYNLQLLEILDRGRWLLLLSWDFFRPNERDRAALRLPRALDAFYYLVRPVRLLCKRLAR